MNFTIVPYYLDEDEVIDDDELMDATEDQTNGLFSSNINTKKSVQLLMGYNYTRYILNQMALL